MSHLIYDELIKSILKIIEKLDLTVEKLDVNEQVRLTTCPLTSAVVGESKSHSLFCFHYACIPPHSVVEVTFIRVKMFDFIFLDIALQC